MADYAIGHQGASLRDALNAMSPMLGLGEYAAAFPPSAPPAPGAPQPTAPAPLLPELLEAPYGMRPRQLEAPYGMPPEQRGPARTQPRIPVAGAQPYQAPGQVVPVPGAISGRPQLRPAVGVPTPMSLTASLTGEGGASTGAGLRDPRNYDYAARLGLTFNR